MASMGESEEAFTDRIIDNLKALIRREGADTIAAFIAEPVTGAGGVFMPPVGYFDKLKPVLDENDILYIDDEVICGFGRTGKAFGIEHFSHGSDHHVGGQGTVFRVLADKRGGDSRIHVRAHEGGTGTRPPSAMDSPTRGIRCAARWHCARSRIYEERDIFAKAAKTGEVMQARIAALADHPLVGDARGIGLLGALELMADGEKRIPFPASLGAGAKVGDRAYELGIILRPLGDTLAICPPIIISEAQVHELFDKLTAALDDCRDVLTNT